MVDVCGLVRVCELVGELIEELESVCVSELVWELVKDSVLVDDCELVKVSEPVRELF